MNKEYMNELIRQAKEAATTPETKALVSDLEQLVELYTQTDPSAMGEEFRQSVGKARDRLSASLGKAMAGFGINADEIANMLPNPANFSEEEWAKIAVAQKEFAKNSAPAVAKSKENKKMKV